MNNMKKKLSVLLAIVIVLTSLIIPVSADTAGSTTDGAYINTGGTLYPVTKGDTYTYEYRLNLGKKLTAIDASLSYDTAGLELVNYSFPILGSSAYVGTYGGKLYINYSSATGIEFSGSSAVLIRATFKVKAENGTFDVHTDITDMARYQEVKIVENGTVISSFNHNELITDDDSKTSIYIETGDKYYKVKRGKTYNYICYLKTDERVGNLEATTKYSSDGLSTDKSSSYYDYYTRSVKTTYQSYSGKSFAEDNTVLVSIPFTVKSNAYDNTTYSITTSISKLLDINEDTISRYTVTEVIEGLSYTMYDPNAPTEAPTEAPTTAPTEPPTTAPTEPPTTAPTEAPTEPPTEPPFEPTEAPWYPPTEPVEYPTEPYHPSDPSYYIILNVDGNLYDVEAGSDHTYSYYLSNAGTICGIDAVTTWNAPFITMVGEPSFPILGQEADLENPGFGGNVVSAYSNDEYGNINMLRFNYTHPEGADFSNDKSEVVTFTIHIDENTAPGMYYIHTYIKTLEGEEEEKQVFEGTDTIEPPVIRNGELDGQPGERVRSYYTADEQTYVSYSEEEKTVTVSDYDHYYDDTCNKFRSLYIDNGYGYYTLVPYNYYTKENEFGSLKLTLKPEYLDTISVGDYNLKFVFSDGEAVGVLHIIEGTPSPTEYSEPHDPTYPNYPYHPEKGVIYFDAASAGWSGARAISFYIYEIGGEALTQWGSKNKSLTTNDGNIWAIDAAGAGVQYGREYGVIFHNLDTGAYTYDLLFDTTCFGDTAYAIPSKLIENPYDTNKASMEARWNRSSLGPRLQITAMGNIVGETVPSNTTKYQMMVDFLASKSWDGLQNVLNFNGKDAQTTIDDIASKLGLTKDDVIKAIDDARTIGNSYNGDRTDWSSSWDASRSTLPGGSSEPTEPPTDSYGYIQGEYYLTGSINGDNSGTANVHKGLRFKDYSSDSMILEGVRLTQGDVVRVARYNGNKTFTVYPDGTGRDVSITQSGRYDFYFKPYELGNGNYWYITPSYLGAIAPYLIGDVDGNEDIEVRDATFIQRCLAKIDTPYTKAELMRGDVDDSGDLEIFDVTCIQYYLANMKTQFPIGTRIE